MTYEQAIRFWFNRINYEQQSPRPGDLTLDRMRALLDRLGNPQEQLPIIHVAGSKGKGSTSAMLANILQQAGYRIGLFTSPHLVQVVERFQVNGIAIAEEELTSLLARVAPVVQEMEKALPGEPGPTFFEIATALGFLHFARQGVEIAVIEVGLGGRFDSTNVCSPLLSIITSISYDHTQQLGNTLASIAREKSGIIKPGRPVISGARAPEARAVIQHIARQQGSPLSQLDIDFRYVHQPACLRRGNTRPPRVEVFSKQRDWPAMDLGLLGDHQAANAALAVVAVEHMRRQGLPSPDDAVAAGLAEVRWPARLEVVCRRPWVILDCAHNLASAQALIDTLRASFPTEAAEKPPRRLLIFAGNRDKDLAGMMQLLRPHFAHLFLTRFSNNPRCLPPEKYLDYLPKTQTPRYTLCPTSANAWHQARAAAGPNDMICITGSVFLAGELRPLILKGDITDCSIAAAAAQDRAGSPGQLLLPREQPPFG